MRKKFSYAFIMEVTDDPTKVVLEFSKKEIAKFLSQRHEGDFNKTLDLLEDELAKEVRRNI